MLPTRVLALVVALVVMPRLSGAATLATVPCPAAADLPQLTIDDIRLTALPVIDRWQVFWGKAPLSDVQLATLAEHDLLIERTTAEARERGPWVFIGMGAAAFGTVVSSSGWMLYGQDNLNQAVTLPLAIGGLLLSIVGVLFVTESIQTPLEPFLAPTPVHRLTRDEAHQLVVRVNTRLYEDICAARQGQAPATAAEQGGLVDDGRSSGAPGAG